jgi:hypothetical protein
MNMLAGILRSAVAIVLFGMAGLQPARADIYTWIDASGRTNISNLDPPPDARVTSVIKSSAVKPETRNDALRDAEVQALAERVRQLQDDVEQARRQATVPVQYQYVPSPPIVQYISIPGPAPMQYADDGASQPAYGCDSSWASCALGWYPGVYPASVVVLRAPGFHRGFPNRGGHHVFAPQPVRGPGSPRRG